MAKPVDNTFEMSYPLAVCDSSHAQQPNSSQKKPKDAIDRIVEELFLSDSAKLEGSIPFKKSHPELTKELLTELYIDKQMSVPEIAERYKVDSRSLTYLLHRLDIPLRSQREAMLIRGEHGFNQFHPIGKDHPS